MNKTVKKISKNTPTKGAKKIPVEQFHGSSQEPLNSGEYNKALKLLEIELVKMQDWVKATNARVIVIFEGRDAAGKGGAIKRITAPLNPRICKVAALGTPTEREKGEWYFQRYVSHLPSSGEIVLFDRSWYNRSGVERVMGFCTEDQYMHFLQDCPEFENLLIRSGIILIKYWFSVSDVVQEARFQDRANDPVKKWKLSPMDIKSRDLWVEYSKAKDRMLQMTSTKASPWYIVNADEKKRARLNCIHHLLSQVPYETIQNHPIKLPKRKVAPSDYIRPPISMQNFVPNAY